MAAIRDASPEKMPVRLIDANRLKQVFSKNIVCAEAFFQLIDAAPTVEGDQKEREPVPPVYTTTTGGNPKTICGTCRRKLSQSWFFCPDCGREIGWSWLQRERVTY